MAVDSGATETVIGEEASEHVELKQRRVAKSGNQYEVADGTLITNLGKKTFSGMSEDGLYPPDDCTSVWSQQAITKRYDNYKGR